MAGQKSYAVGTDAPFYLYIVAGSLAPSFLLENQGPSPFDTIFEN